MGAAAVFALEGGGGGGSTFPAGLADIAELAACDLDDGGGGGIAAENLEIEIHP